jgi:hypothetical protein
MSDGKTGNPTNDVSGNRPKLNEKLQDSIGKALQVHYQALVREPIPDRLIHLLAELETGELDHE